MTRAHLIVPFILSILIFGSGCVSNTRQPLPASAGWTLIESRDPRELSMKIRDDYKAYIQSLPRLERIQVTESSALLFKNVNGGHAIQFKIVKDGFWSSIVWDYVLIYDSTDKRVKTVKFRSGRSMS